MATRARGYLWLRVHEAIYGYACATNRLVGGRRQYVPARRAGDAAWDAVIAGLSSRTGCAGRACSGWARRSEYPWSTPVSDAVEHREYSIHTVYLTVPFVGQ